MPRERIYGDDISPVDLLIDWTKQAGDPGGHGQIGAVFITVTRKDETDAEVAVRMNRTGINRAINALRRARDQAYGRDE